MLLLGSFDLQKPRLSYNCNVTTPESFPFVLFISTQGVVLIFFIPRISM